MSRLTPMKCSKHPHFYLPCYRCRKLSQLYKCPEPDLSRINAIQKFSEKYPDIELYNETCDVFSEWLVDDEIIKQTIDKCNAKVDRLELYPSFHDVRDMFVETSNFLESLLQIKNYDTIS